MSKRQAVSKQHRSGRTSKQTRIDPENDDAMFEESTGDPRYLEYDDNSAGECLYKRNFKCRFFEHLSHKDGSWKVNIQVCILCSLLRIDYTLYKGGVQ